MAYWCKTFFQFTISLEMLLMVKTRNSFSRDQLRILPVLKNTTNFQ